MNSKNAINSNSFKKIFGTKFNSKANPESETVLGNIRITVLTDCLIRIEKDSFTDAATQTVLNRDFPQTVFKITDTDDTVTVATKKAVLCIDKHNLNLIYTKTKDCGKTEKISDNLKGTYRTLDMTSGKIKLEDGIMSKSGIALLDDSKAFILNEDGTIGKRENCFDKYFFAYGRNYRQALKDFYLLTGPTPLLPRFCLGNWWSRYWAYTQEEYLSLMNRFEKESIPLTVATVDMDWHWVNVIPKFGIKASNLMTKREKGEKQRYHITGWTGYSWNTDLFPDYKSFLVELHNKKLKTTLNLHPAAGVRFYENQYNDMAEAMGTDPKTKKHIAFDITDPVFIDAYFRILHHPYENDGVDFWWIDWQQGNKTKIPGLDPLWALNHYHYLDNCRNGKRGLILSRYAGPGSHRYPLGFSGDTVIGKGALDFQPEFTATASNIGYTWWSHDIGGHTMGIHSDEIYLRWIQLGVFSPINRLHSTQDKFMGKEPWNYRPETEKTAKEWLRFRKRLIPYIYTANYRTHTEGKALIEPMYYEQPFDEDAYKVNNQFIFGGSLICAPITELADKKTGLAGVKVYLDGKKYTDIFTGDIYSYNGIHRMYRYTDTIPVLAREGSIIPLDTDETTNGADIPTNIELLIFNGNGSCELYEDDGETLKYQNEEYEKRLFEICEKDGDIEFTINPSSGKCSAVPGTRSFRLSFRNIENGADFHISGCDKYRVGECNDYLTIDIFDVKSEDKITVEIKNFTVYIPKTRDEKKTALLSRINGNNIAKTIRYSVLTANGKIPPVTGKHIKNALKEIDLQAEKK